jgi:hypothetical protein
MVTITLDPAKCQGSTKKTAIVRTNDPGSDTLWLSLTWRFEDS